MGAAGTATSWTRQLPQLPVILRLLQPSLLLNREPKVLVIKNDRIDTEHKIEPLISVQKIEVTSMNLKSVVFFLLNFDQEVSSANQFCKLLLNV